MDITITLAVTDGLLVATTDKNGQAIGTIGDNNSQTLIFDRSGLTGDMATGNLQLSFLPTSSAWQVINIGTESSYTIPNSLTGAGNLMLAVALIVGDTTITGANRISFAFRAGGSTAGTTPSTIDSAWVTVRDNAMLTTVYDTDKDGVIDATALPLSSAVDSDSRTTAATSTALKTAYDLASSFSNIGGRNYLRNTETSLVATGSGIANQIATGYLISSETLAKMELAAGDWVALSFKWEATGSGIAGNFTSQFSAAPWVFDTGLESVLAIGTNGSNSPTTTISSTNVSGRITVIGKIKSNSEWLTSTATRLNIRMDSVPSTVQLTFSNMQMEKGRAVTGWWPSPEDILNRLASIETAIVALGGTI